MQFAVIGMAAGLVGLVVIVLSIAPPSASVAAAAARIWLAGLAIVTALLLISILLVRAWTTSQLRDFASRAARGDDPPGQVTYAYGSGRLIAAALAESIGVLGAVAFILTQEPLTLVACAISALLVLAHMPTVGEFRRLAQSAIVH
jgi:hypothetical protein